MLLFQVIRPKHKLTELDVRRTEKLIDLANLASTLNVSDPDGTLRDTETAKERIVLHMNGQTCDRSVPEVILAFLYASSRKALTVIVAVFCCSSCRTCARTPASTKKLAKR